MRKYTSSPALSTPSSCRVCRAVSYFLSCLITTFQASSRLCRRITPFMSMPSISGPSTQSRQSTQWFVPAPAAHAQYQSAHTAHQFVWQQLLVSRHAVYQQLQLRRRPGHPLTHCLAARLKLSLQFDQHHCSTGTSRLAHHGSLTMWVFDFLYSLTSSRTLYFSCSHSISKSSLACCCRRIQGAASCQDLRLNMSSCDIE